MLVGTGFGSCLNCFVGSMGVCLGVLGSMALALRIVSSGVGYDLGFLCAVFKGQGSTRAREPRTRALPILHEYMKGL